MSDLFMLRTAVLAFDDTCRLTLGRVWDAALPIAAWLQCNPSDADHMRDDQTARRMVHFSRAAGCGGFVGVNVRPWRTPYPVELWRAIRAGLITEPMMAANDVAICEAAKADVLFISTGVEPPRRDRAAFNRALDLYSATGRPLWCLGESPDGWPLHPLARGKQAIPNDRRPSEWRLPA